MITTSPPRDSIAWSKKLEPSATVRLAASGAIAAFVVVMALGFFLVIPAGKIPGTGSVYDLHLAGTFAEFKKLMLKLKLDTRGKLGILGICGIRKLDLSCR